MTTVDVLVVGGGPAGAAAAITAADAGLATVVCDKALFPRDKACGDGLTAGALRLLERLGLEPAAVPSFHPVTEVVLCSPSGRVVELSMPTNGLFAATAPRVELDHALVELAGKRGAELRLGAGLTELEVGTDDVRARFSDGSEVRARYVLAADGAYSTVRRLLAPPRSPRLGEWHAFRQYFTGVPERRLWVVFEPDVLPGYAWVFPLPDGRANVGFGLPRQDGRPARFMAGLWRELLERPGLRRVLGEAEPEGSHRAWPIPADVERAPLAEGRVLFVGDAAGVTDPMTGEGIAQALVTGILAAEAVQASGDPTAAGQRYRQDVERHLGPDLRFARRLGGVLRHRKGARGAVRVAGLSAWTRANFARWLFEDYPRALILTPSRWRRGAMSSPGAYLGD
jgi:geranylgeranyl reductase family protein